MVDNLLKETKFVMRLIITPAHASQFEFGTGSMIRRLNDTNRFSFFRIILPASLFEKSQSEPLVIKQLMGVIINMADIK